VSVEATRDSQLHPAQQTLSLWVRKNSFPTREKKIQGDCCKALECAGDFWIRSQKYRTQKQNRTAKETISRAKETAFRVGENICKLYIQQGANSLAIEGTHLDSNNNRLKWMVHACNPST
jgi:hypothetical protein